MSYRNPETHQMVSCPYCGRKDFVIRLLPWEGPQTFLQTGDCRRCSFWSRTMEKNKTRYGNKIIWGVSPEGCLYVLK